MCGIRLLFCGLYYMMSLLCILPLSASIIAFNYMHTEQNNIIVSHIVSFNTILVPFISKHPVNDFWITYTLLWKKQPVIMVI